MTKNNEGKSQQESLVRALLKQKYDDLEAAELARRKLEEELRYKNALIRRRDIEIQESLDLVQRMDQQVSLMRASKFWKLRNLYFRFRLFVFNPSYLRRKLARLSFQRVVQSKVKVPPKSRQKIMSGPLISVIVPNYNHARFLRERLDSIYGQTYRNFEVILLDDKSTDASREILDKYYKKYKANTRRAFNNKNSGNVFAQWKKGISMAKGKLIWIAESDDLCDKDFLEKLIPHFEDESVMLAYAHPVFVDEDGSAYGFTFESYVSGLSGTKWTKSYVETAHNEVRSALGIKNTIPNVSGVIFRNIPVDQFDYDGLKQFRVCGDWYFYLSIIRGGQIAYVHETNNYYRFHPNNTSTNYHQNINFVKEHETIAKHVARNYKVSPTVLARNMASVQEVWNNQNPYNAADFYKAYRMAEVKKEQAARKPNILMAIFAFTTGGGETVPVRLANKLKERGYAVTIFEYYTLEPHKNTIRGMLRNDIPVAKNGLKGLDALISEFGIEVIHTHHAEVDAAFGQTKNKKAGQLVTMHGMYEALPSEVVKDLAPQVKSVDHWVYVADKNLGPLGKFNWFTKAPKTKITNGFEPPKGPAGVSRKSLKISDDDFVVCLASRALREKGWRQAVDAVRLANMKSKRRILLLMVGDGPIYDQLMTQEKEDNVRLLGFKENVYEYFALADVGILPTMFSGESCPLTLIECIAAHKPFISTNIGEIKSMLTLQDGSVAGEVFDLHDGQPDVYDLARFLSDLANNRELYEERRMNAIVCSQRFSMDLVAEKYGQVYEEIISQRLK